jgi:curved DNA-binding protein
MDYYNILGVNKNSSQDEIKKAYRKLAAQHHPDRGGDTKKFQEIQAAYDTLSDPQKRELYDNPPQHPQGGFHFRSNGFPPGFDDFFEQAFGNMFGRRQQRNRNLNLQTRISLEEAFWGKDFIANVKLPSGKEQVLEIKIPRGINDGVTIKLSGLGDNSIPELPRGDIYLTVQVEPHAEFKRQANDLIKEISVNCLDAIVGKTIEFKSIENKFLEVNINPGIQHGQFISIPDHGMPDMNNNNVRGRLLLHVNISIPTNLDKVQIDKIKEILTFKKDI